MAKRPPQIFTIAEHMQAGFGPALCPANSKPVPQLDLDFEHNYFECIACQGLYHVKQTQYILMEHPYMPGKHLYNIFCPTCADIHAQLLRDTKPRIITCKLCTRKIHFAKEYIYPRRFVVDFNLPYKIFIFCFECERYVRRKMTESMDTFKGCLLARAKNPELIKTDQVIIYNVLKTRLPHVDAPKLLFLVLVENRDMHKKEANAVKE